MSDERNEEYAIIVEDVHKTFKVYLDRANTIKEKLLFLFTRNRKEKREVLKGINLKIKKGEAVALIGVNGGGKSTLLKLMTKIIYPSKGKITINGKLTSLLELENWGREFELLSFEQNLSKSNSILLSSSFFSS